MEYKFVPDWRADIRPLLCDTLLCGQSCSNYPVSEKRKAVMYENLLGENLQEVVTIGYGMEMEKRGNKRTEERFKEALASSGISEEEKNKIMENYKKLSSD